VVALFSDDGAWYRGYVEAVTDSDCQVRFVDYGNSDKAARASLRLPTDELLKEKSQAAMCRLAGVKPLQQGGSHISDARDMFDGLVKDTVVKCKIVGVKDGLYSVELSVEGTDVKQKLVKAAVVKEEKPVSASASQENASEATLRYPPAVELLPGSTESVFISHIDSVASFWCQPLKYETQLEEVMAKLEDYCTSDTGVQSFPIDMACAAKFSLDEGWYRARVTAAYDDSVEVHFVDYGNSEKVQKSDVCLLNEDLVSLPPQAVECELQNAVKASNQLTAKFKELIEEKDVTATIVDVQDDICTVSLTLPGGQNIAEALELVEAGASVVTVSSPPSARPRTHSSPTQHFVVPAVPDKSSVFLSNIITPGEFYIQRVDQEDALTELMEKVSQHCQTAPGVGALVNGLACCALYSEDGSWYRAKVVTCDGKTATVEFVDYGNSEDTSSDNLRSISDELVQVPVFAVKCFLSGVKPTGTDWSDEAVAKFEELTLDKELECVKQGDNYVKLIADADIAEALIENGLGTKELEEIKEEPVVEDIVEKIQQKNINDIKAAPEVECNKATLEPSTSSKLSAIKFADQVVPTGPVVGFISHVDDDDGTVYVQLKEQEELLTTLVDQIQTIGNTASIQLSDVCNGDKVCAKFSEDESWYRAEVLSRDSDSVRVRFLDYGNCDTVTKSEDLRAVTPQYAAMPALAFPCKLANTARLTADQVEQLTAATADQELTITFMTGSPVYEITAVDGQGVSLAETIGAVVEEGATSEEKSTTAGNTLV